MENSIADNQLVHSGKPCANKTKLRYQLTKMNSCNTHKPGPEVIKLFSSSAQLSMKFQLLINAEIVKISEKFRFKPQKLVIYPDDKC